MLEYVFLKNKNLCEVNNEINLVYPEISQNLFMFTFENNFKMLTKYSERVSMNIILLNLILFSIKILIF